MERENASWFGRLDQCWNPLLHNSDNLPNRVSSCLIFNFFLVTYRDQIHGDQFTRILYWQNLLIESTWPFSCFLLERVCFWNDRLFLDNTLKYPAEVMDVNCISPYAAWSCWSKNCFVFVSFLLFFFLSRHTLKTPRIARFFFIFFFN